jgi:hypothetical protein
VNIEANHNYARSNLSKELISWSLATNTGSASVVECECDFISCENLPKPEEVL